MFLQVFQRIVHIAVRNLANRFFHFGAANTDIAHFRVYLKRGDIFQILVQFHLVPDIHRRLTHGLHFFLRHGLVQTAGYELGDRFLHCFAAMLRLDHFHRHLAGPETGHAHPFRNAFQLLLVGLAQFFRRNGNGHLAADVAGIFY